MRAYLSAERMAGPVGFWRFESRGLPVIARLRVR